MIGARVPIVVVSLGADGAAACVDGRAVAVEGYDVGPSIDTTGAGDLFVAAWAWGDAVGLPSTTPCAGPRSTPRCRCASRPARAARPTSASSSRRAPAAASRPRRRAASGSPERARRGAPRPAPLVGGGSRRRRRLRRRDRAAPRRRRGATHRRPPRRPHRARAAARSASRCARACVGRVDAPAATELSGLALVALRRVLDAQRLGRRAAGVRARPATGGCCARSRVDRARRRSTGRTSRSAGARSTSATSATTPRSAPDITVYRFAEPPAGRDERRGRAHRRCATPTAPTTPRRCSSTRAAARSRSSPRTSAASPASTSRSNGPPAQARARCGSGVGQPLTAGDVSADGRTIVLRSYDRAFVWTRRRGESLAARAQARAVHRRRGPARRGPGRGARAHPRRARVLHGARGPAPGPAPLRGDPLGSRRRNSQTPSTSPAAVADAPATPWPSWAAIGPGQTSAIAQPTPNSTSRRRGGAPARPSSRTPARRSAARAPAAPSAPAGRRTRSPARRRRTSIR